MSKSTPEGKKRKEKASKSQAKKASPSKGRVFELEEDLTGAKDLPLRFRYWRRWIVVPVSLKTAATFPAADSKHIDALKKKFLTDSTVDNLGKLYRAAHWKIKDGDVIEKVSELLYKSSVKLPKIESYRGATNTVKLRDKVIKQDIESFKAMVSEWLDGDTVQHVTRDWSDKKVWNHYIKPAKLIIKTLECEEGEGEAWEFAFRCFEIMASLVGHTHPTSACQLTFKGQPVLLVRTEGLIKDGIDIYPN